MVHLPRSLWHMGHLCSMLRDRDGILPNGIAIPFSNFCGFCKGLILEHLYYGRLRYVMFFLDGEEMRGGDVEVLVLRYSVERGQVLLFVAEACSSVSSLSISSIGRSYPVVETTAAGLDKASENWHLTFQIKKDGPHHAR